MVRINLEHFRKMISLDDIVGKEVGLAPLEEPGPEREQRITELTYQFYSDGILLDQIVEKIDDYLADQAWMAIPTGRYDPETGTYDMPDLDAVFESYQYQVQKADEPLILNIMFRIESATES